MSTASPADNCPILSIVIVNWNTRDLLRACLRSLPWDSPQLCLEVIVVDNASSDGSAEMVEADFPAVHLIRNEENAGFVRANNEGLAAATGDELFMLNSDTEVRPGAIERLHEVVSADPTIGVAGPRLLNTDGSPQVSFGPFPRTMHRLFPSRFEETYRQGIERRATASRTSGLHPRASEHTADVDWLSGAALYFRRDVYERVGGLDERYYMWYDDLDWAQKLRRAGLRRVFVSDAVIVHHGRQSGRQLTDRRLAEQLFDSEYTYLRLHHGRAAACLVFALRMGKALARRLLGGVARDDARWRLDYHRRNFRRFCLVRELPRYQDR